MSIAKGEEMTCEHGTILIVWDGGGSLEEIWCGECEADVTNELGTEEVTRALRAGAAKRTLEECGYGWGKK